MRKGGLLKAALNEEIRLEVPILSNILKDDFENARTKDWHIIVVGAGWLWARQAVTIARPRPISSLRNQELKQSNR